MYRIAIPEPMKKAYFTVIDECTELGEEKIAYVFSCILMKYFKYFSSIVKYYLHIYLLLFILKI